MFNKIKSAILDINAAKVSSNKSGIKNVAAGALAVAASMPMVFASNKGISGMFASLKKLLKDVYTGIDGIITFAGVTVIGIALLTRIFSKNQRSVDEATAWIKRVIITLIAWKFMGLLVSTIDGAAGNQDKFNWDSYK